MISWEQKGPLMESPCRICGATEGESLLTKTLGKFVSKWVFCEGCQSAHIDPYPSEDVLIEYYNSNYLDMGLQDENSLGVSHQLRFSEAYRNTVFNEYNYSCADADIDLAVISKAKKKILDYGCANGVFLEYLNANGCSKEDIYGYDIGESMVEEACSKGFNCTTRLSQFQDQSFDLITLWDVIEHVPYPIDTVKEIRRLLRGGGECFSRRQILVNWQF